MVSRVLRTSSKVAAHLGKLKTRRQTIQNVVAFNISDNVIGLRHCNKSTLLGSFRTTKPLEAKQALHTADKVVLALRNDGKVVVEY